MNQTELDAIIEKHKLWLDGKKDGKRANFTGKSLNGLNIAGANLEWANFKSADLTGANLSGANLALANFKGSNLSGANFTGANIAGANFREANTTGADFTGEKVDLTLSIKWKELLFRDNRVRTLPWQGNRARFGRRAKTGRKR